MTVDDLSQRSHGTIFDTITRQTFEFVDAVIPPTQLASEFETAVVPIMDRILGNLTESMSVRAQRDALLPKLVSGEIVVEGRLSKKLVPNGH